MLLASISFWSQDGSASGRRRGAEGGRRGRILALDGTSWCWKIPFPDETPHRNHGLVEDSQILGTIYGVFDNGVIGLFANIDPQNGPYVSNILAPWSIWDRLI